MNTRNLKEIMMQANDPGNYHKYLFGMFATDGALQLATTYHCFWFLDMIASYQQVISKEDFQIWTLRKNTDSSAWIIAEDGNGKILVKQEIKYTNFKMEQATVWVEGKVILLSSEH